MELTSLPRSSHVPSTSHHNSLTVNVAEKRTCNSEDNTCRFSCSAWSPEWDICMCIAASGFLLGFRYPEGNLSAVGCGYESTFFFRCCQPGQDVPERDTLEIVSNCIRILSTSSRLLTYWPELQIAGPILWQLLSRNQSHLPWPCHSLSGHCQ